MGYRHGCGDCQVCDGTIEQPCSWGECNDGHVYPECPGSDRCGQPWPGCHHCGALRPCLEPCWYDPKDADGNPMLFDVKVAAS